MAPVSANKNRFRIGLEEKELKWLIDTYAGKDESRRRVATAIFGPEGPSEEVVVRPVYVGRFEGTAAQYHHYLTSKRMSVIKTTAKIASMLYSRRMNTIAPR